MSQTLESYAIAWQQIVEKERMLRKIGCGVVEMYEEATDAYSLNREM